MRGLHNDGLERCKRPAGARTRLQPAVQSGTRVSLHFDHPNAKLTQPRTNQSNRYDSFYDVVMGFLHAIDWQHDRWLRLLLFFHLVAYFVTYKTRKSTTAQVVLLMLWSACVYASQTLNEIGKATWPSFSTQNYFDNNGEQPISLHLFIYKL